MCNFQNPDISRHILPHLLRSVLLVVGFGMAGYTPAVHAAVITVRTAEAAQDALDAALPGDEIVLEDDRYVDLRLTVASRGESTGAVVLRGAENHGVILTGRSEIRITGTHVEVRGLNLADCEYTTGSKGGIQFDGASHCRVTSCTFERSRFGNVPLVNFRNGAHDNRLDHCRFLDTRYRSVTVTVDNESLRAGAPVRNRIDHNLFQDVPPLGANGAETIQIGQRAAPHADLHLDTVIENNLFVRCNGEAEIISLKTGGNIIRNNLFRDCEGELVLRHGHRNRVEGNRFDGGLGGIRVSGNGHTVIGNTIARCEGTGIRLYFGTPDSMHPASYLPVHGCLFADNVIMDCGEAGILVGDRRNAHYRNAKWSGPPWFASETMDCTVAPYNNVFENNIVTGKQGSLLKVVEAPDNVIRDNVFHQDEGYR